MRDLKHILRPDESASMTSALVFHEDSSYDPHRLADTLESIEDFFSTEQDTALEDHHPHKPAITLPSPPKQRWWHAPRSSLIRLLFSRRSRRDFSQTPLSLIEISTLLQWSYGRRPGDDGRLYATVPSAGGLYPLHIYLCALHTALPRGLYHYYYTHPTLRTLRQDDAIARLFTHETFAQNLQGEPALLCFLVADLRKTHQKYGERGYRFGLIEAGHLGQNFMLVCEVLGLSCVPLGGFYDRHIHQALSLTHPAQKALYALAIGKTAHNTP